MRMVLTALTGSLAGRPFVVERGALELGRGETCAVRFAPEEQQVSRRHAVVTLEAGGFHLADRSTNGTLVNGRPVAEAWLQSGDVLQLGRGGPCVRVEIEASAPEAGGDERSAPSGRDAVGGDTAHAAALQRVEARLYYDPECDKGRRHGLVEMAVVFGMVLAGSALGLLTVLLTFFQLGVFAALVGVVVAVVPAPLYLAVWLWLDRYDPEPAWILAGAFVWGAGAATFVAGVINSLFQAGVAAATQDQAIAQFLSASLSAPLGEELLKGLAVLAIFLFLRREFDGVVDGIAYAGVVALGFATVENVLYYGRAMAARGPGLLLVVFGLRGVLGPFAHAVFTSMIGIGCGLARETRHRGLRVALPLAGYAGAVTLHGLWNTLAALSGGVAGTLVVYTVVWLPLFLVFFGVVVLLGRREAQLIERVLQLEIARGLLTREQVRMAGSWPRRVAWLAADLRRLAVRRRFLHAMTRLAMCYWHAGRAEAGGFHTVSAAQVPVFQREIRTLLPLV